MNKKLLVVITCAVFFIAVIGCLVLHSHNAAAANKQYADDYAGSYTDDNGNYHVNLTSDKNLKQYKSNLKGYSVVFSKVKYSLNTLSAVEKLLTKNMKKYNICSITITEKTDTVEIGVAKTDNEKAITKLVNKAGYDSDCINFEITGPVTLTDYNN